MARSLKMPARPAAAIPSKQTKMPNKITRPEFVPRTWLTNTPLKMGGIKVPKAAHRPRATAMPRERPRKRIVRPKVSPPMPQRSPKKNDQNRLLVGASDKTPRRSRVMRLPKKHGAMLQLRLPHTRPSAAQDHGRPPRQDT